MNTTDFFDNNSNKEFRPLEIDIFCDNGYTSIY